MDEPKLTDGRKDKQKKSKKKKKKKKEKKEREYGVVYRR